MTKIKVYELDFGDTNLFSKHKDGILSWIESEMVDLKKAGQVLNYKITITYMTKAKYDKLPEWS